MPHPELFAMPANPDRTQGIWPETGSRCKSQRRLALGAIQDSRISPVRQWGGALVVGVAVPDPMPVSTQPDTGSGRDLPVVGRCQATAFAHR